MKKNLFNLHWNIYQYLKKKSLSYEGKASSSIKRYREDQKYYNQRSITKTTQEHLLNSCLDSQIIYLGDFHTFDQNQRSLHRIMRTLLRNKKKFKLGLEMVHAEHQHFLDAYIEGHISEFEFLESINYSESWRFPWNHYKMIFDLVKKEQIAVIGLNCPGKLEERDLFAAQTIAQELAQDPACPILVLYGELHILPNKLPKQVLLNIKREIRQTIIHQNIDEVYWDLRKKSEEAKIVNFSRDEFCLMTSAPWVKYESMIYCYENLSDDPDFDMHEYMIENGVLTFGANAYDNFSQIINSVVVNLGLNVDQDKIDNFTLYDHTQLEEVEEAIAELSPRQVKKFYIQLLELNRHMKIPDKNIYYCPSYSLNKMASLAGFHLYNLFITEQGTSDLELINSTEKQHVFIFMTFQHMYGYFFAKIFNPHRKCNLYLDIEQEMNDSNSKRQQKFLMEVLQIINDEIDLTTFFHKMKNDKIYTYARQVGYFFGEYLYHGLANQSIKLNSKQLQTQFFMAPINIEYYQIIKNYLLPNKMYKMQRKRFF